MIMNRKMRKVIKTISGANIELLNYYIIIYMLSAFSSFKYFYELIKFINLHFSYINLQFSCHKCRLSNI